jgi:hypothetical protein
MMTNVGVLDAALRFVCGAALLALGYGRLGVHLTGGPAWIVWIAGLLLVVTAIFRYCPAYAFFGTDSCALYPGKDARRDPQKH